MFKYFNHRSNVFGDSTHSRTGTPYNVLDPSYVRRQNFSAEYQFDFWLSFEKMIVNGYQGDFEGEENSNRLALDSTRNNRKKFDELCLKTGIDFGYSGVLTFDSS